MKVFDDLRKRNDDLYSDCMDRLNRCVMAHGGLYMHNIDKYGPILARCWNEDEDGIELYEVFDLHHDAEGELVMTVASHDGNQYFKRGVRFEKPAASLLADYVITIIAEMGDPVIGYGHHFGWNEMNEGVF